jgi:two-component system response regulator YesN
MRVRPLYAVMGKHHLFVRLLMPYIFFMILALLLGWLLYYRTFNLLENEATRSNLLLLEQVKDMLDRRLSEIDTIARQITNEPRVMSFQQVENPFDGPNTYRVIDMQKGLHNYSASNNFVIDYFLLFKKSNLAVSSNSTHEIPSFYQQVLMYDNMDYRTWYEYFVGIFHNRQFFPVHNVTLRGKSSSMLTYVKTLGYPWYPTGALVILIDNKDMLKPWDSIDTSDGGWACILDEKGQVLSSFGNKELVPDATLMNQSKGIIGPSRDTKQMLITYTKSSYNGWTYIVAQPPHIVLQKVIYIKKITFTVVFLFLGLGVLLAYLFAYRNSKPWTRILNTIKERFSGDSTGSEDPYGFVQSTLTRLIDNNYELGEKIERQAPFLKATIFDGLLKGDFMIGKGVKDIEALLKYQKMDLAGSSYMVAILHFRYKKNDLSSDVLYELDVNRVLVKDILRNTTGNDAYSHDVSEDTLALLFLNRTNDQLKFRPHVEQILHEVLINFRTQLENPLSVSVGGIYYSLLNVSRSYEEARQAMNLSIWGYAPGIVWFTDLPKLRQGYYYPGEVESRLMNYSKAGDRTGTNKLLQELQLENLKDRNLSPSMLNLFLFEMLGTLVKVKEQLGLEDEADVKKWTLRIHSEEDSHQLLQSFTDEYGKICDYVNERKKSQNVHLIEEALHCVHSSYMLADLSLELLAEKLNVSKVYLSQFFKEQSGVNFSDYLEGLRMDRAKELLRTTDLPIKEIVDLTGYYSSNTFGRAFRRIHGISATEYRSSFQLE